jgi:hypothetical protein
LHISLAPFSSHLKEQYTLLSLSDGMEGREKLWNDAKAHPF